MGGKWVNLGFQRGRWGAGTKKLIPRSPLPCSVVAAACCLSCCLGRFFTPTSHLLREARPAASVARWPPAQGDGRMSRRWRRWIRNKLRNKTVEEVVVVFGDNGTADVSRTSSSLHAAANTGVESTSARRHNVYKYDIT